MRTPARRTLRLRRPPVNRHPAHRQFVFGPMCGSWMDRAARPLVIQWGIGLQCAGVALALCVLGLLVASRPQGTSPQGAAAAEAAAGRLPVGLLLAMIGCGSLEVLGAMISSVAVKKDWVTPTRTPTLTLTLMGNPDPDPHPDPDPNPNLNADINRNPNRNPNSNQLPDVWATLELSLCPTLPLAPTPSQVPLPLPPPLARYPPCGLTGIVRTSLRSTWPWCALAA